jgi:hypothetical protein
MALTIRHTDPDAPHLEHFQVYSREVRIGTIYRTHSPNGDVYSWAINGIYTGPPPFGGWAKELDDAKAQLGAAWRRWLAAAGLTEIEPPPADS